MNDSYVHIIDMDVYSFSVCFVAIRNSILILKSHIKLKNILPESYTENITKENAVSIKNKIIEFIDDNPSLSDKEKTFMKVYIDRDSVSELTRTLIDLRVR